jgi:Mg2+/citrate symporter
MVDAAPPFVRMVPQLIISICVFPLVAWIVSRIDAWRLGR